MQKIVYIVSLFLIISSCSVYRGQKARSSGTNSEKDYNSKDSYIRSKNLTNDGFYLKSLDIIISNGNSRNKFSGSLKFEKPDKYLLTLRSISGIEIARIFISRDSVYLMDRIKHKVYRTEGKYIYREYGFAIELLPVLLGDYIGKCNSVFSDRNGGNILEAECKVAGFNVIYLFNENVGKVTSALGRRGDNEYGSIKFDKFRNISGLIYPGRIQFNNEKRKMNAEFVIRKIEFPWNEKVTFNVGDRYEILDLL